ncbi:MAG: hypothetical protein HC910_17620 [Spirulinaceae cyanobacterium SM2_1_0]|nr:hypothetical protein [Spirulinaceae cyanobacterium SM2_1_0]
MFSLRKLFASIGLSLLLLLTACSAAPPSDFQQAQQESTERGATAVVKDAEQGSRFNKFFPSPQDGYDVVYTQEKKGFAEAKLKQNGQDVAMLAVSDISSTPTTADKFADSTDMVAGYPVATQGNTATAVLVADRFQVKVLSRSPDFSSGDRLVWLEKFDLDGIATLAN